MKSTKKSIETIPNIAAHWIEKNCCLHPDHDLKNAVLYLGSLSLTPALNLLQTIRKSAETNHTCGVKTTEGLNLSFT
jgi:hypothetical protein|tara:strand:- start:417 stop:647 length:231 start_codon:yes stop_codon:yes gene_type:complete